MVDPPAELTPAGAPVITRQRLEATGVGSAADELTRREGLLWLERVYWDFLERTFLGVLRIGRTAEGREIALLVPTLVLLRLGAPRLTEWPGGGSVAWPIQRGLLVAPPGRGRGVLRLTVERVAGADTDDGRVLLGSEVEGYLPSVAGWGLAARLAAPIYRVTQLQVHVVLTHAFLRWAARTRLGG